MKNVPLTITRDEMVRQRVKYRQSHRTYGEMIAIKQRWQEHNVRCAVQRIKQNGIAAEAAEINKGGKFNDLLAILAAANRCGYNYVQTEENSNHIFEFSVEKPQTIKALKTWTISEFYAFAKGRRDDMNFALCVVAAILCDYYMPSLSDLLCNEGMLNGKFKGYLKKAGSQAKNFVNAMRSRLNDFDNIYSAIVSEASKSMVVAYCSVTNDMNRNFFSNTKYWGLHAVLLQLTRIALVCALESHFEEWMTLPQVRANLKHLGAELPQDTTKKATLGQSAHDALWALINKLIEIIVK